MNDFRVPIFEIRHASACERCLNLVSRSSRRSTAIDNASICDRCAEIVIKVVRIEDDKADQARNLAGLTAYWKAREIGQR